ncbi:hypothetical protein [Micromonospora thermarum]|nr:hypothetical protein [Micromonospora thermarum]
MTLEQSRNRRPPNRDGESGMPARLPLRWLIIMGISAAVGIMIGSAEGVPAGVLASVVTAGALHKIVK